MCLDVKPVTCPELQKEAKENDRRKLRTLIGLIDVLGVDFRSERKVERRQRGGRFFHVALTLLACSFFWA